MIPPTPSPAEAADIAAITGLAAAYSEAMCRFAVAEAVQVYTEDGVLSSPTTEDAVGRAAIEAVISRTVSGLDLLFQTMHCPLVVVHGDRARARVPITEWARRREDRSGLQFLGVYDDEVVRTPEGWRFARRRLIPVTLGRPASFTGRVQPLPPPELW